jgi:uncharacterized protein (DUF58 family)
MPTRRGWATLGTGLAMWVAARLIGSRDLHMIAAAITILPLLAIAFVRWSHPRLVVRRELSTSRAYPGARVTVTIAVENHGHTTTSYLLLEDAIPVGLGSPARLVVTAIPPRNDHKVSYSVVARQRGRFTIGPLAVYHSDPFGLAKTKAQAGPEAELVVYPAVEDVDARSLVSQGAGSGDAAAKRLHRAAAEFYTMREYITGDDLRRIHWPSVARTGTLMIRQDESTRRSSAILLLDTRSGALGPQGSPGFETAVSVAATLGRALARSGFSLRMTTVDATPRPVTEDVLLDMLAGIGPSRSTGFVHALAGLRSPVAADTTLALVTAPPTGAEVAALSRTGAAFGRRLLVLIYPRPLRDLPPEAVAEIEGRAAAARGSLQRSGWEVVIMQPDGKLAETWRRTKTQKLQVAGSLS